MLSHNSFHMYAQMYKTIIISRISNAHSIEGYQPFRAGYVLLQLFTYDPWTTNKNSSSIFSRYTRYYTYSGKFSRSKYSIAQ